mmetsp:Transcript_64200/g.54400  ORF Transcript_64200/g.54400 Transcript_64200/m.54400 type:complete len:116 (+) Transcript_64200:330-677(+)
MKNSCKNVIKIITHFEHDSNIFFIYEKGESILYDYINSRKHLDLASRVRILLDVAYGIQSLHNVSVAHVDLKLENIMKIGDEFKLIDIESSIDFSQTINEDVNIKSSLSTMPPEL